MFADQLALGHIFEAGQVGAGPIVRRLDPRPLVRPAGEEGDALRLDHVERGGSVEHRLQHRRPAGRQRGADHQADIARPEQAIAGPAHHRFAHREDPWPAPPLDAEGALGVDDSLGQAGGPGREEDAAMVGRGDGRGALRHLCIGHRRATGEESIPAFIARRWRIGIGHAVELDQPMEKRPLVDAGQHGGKILLHHPRVEEEDADRRGMDQMLQFLRARKAAERHGDAPRHRDAEDAGEIFGPVRHQHADPAILAEAGRDQRLGHRHGPGVELVIAPADAPIRRAHHDRIARAVPRPHHVEIGWDGLRALPRLLRQRRTMDQRKRRAQ